MAATAESSDQSRRRRWGSQRALSDDSEAVELLLEAAGRCIMRHGSTNFAMVEVAEEAGVTRSTLYRYFSTRAQLVTALLLSRAEAFVAASVASLPDPDDAHISLTRMIVHPIETVGGTPLTEALFSRESEGLAVSVELESDAIFQIANRHFGPVLSRWQAAGQLQPDIDVTTTVRWIIALAVLLLSAPWRQLSSDERTAFVDTYVARALLSR